MHGDQSAGREDREYGGPSPELPLDPDALYNEGMAHYRNRRWRQAQECFTQLKRLQPERRGLDALLRELEIFIRLDAAQPDVALEEGAEYLLPIEEEQPLAQVPLTNGNPRWWVILLVVLGVIGGVALVIALGRGKQSAELYNYCQANTVGENWCKAAEACCERAVLVPADREALNNCEKAKRQLYLAAEGLIQDDKIDEAIEGLKCLYTADAQYRDVGLLLACLDALRSARQLQGEGQCREAATALEKLRVLSPDCLVSGVSQALYQAYACQGAQLLAQAGGAIVPASGDKVLGYVLSPQTLVTVSEAVAVWGRAAKEKPASAEAQGARELAQNLLLGLERYRQGAWGESIPPLAALVRRAPGYLEGKAALVLCDARLRLAGAYFQGGDYVGALRECQAAIGGPGCAAAPAQTCMQQAALRLTPTATLMPTATATSTPTPTNTPRPTTVPSPTSTTAPTVRPTDRPPPPPPPPPPPTEEKPPPR